MKNFISKMKQIPVDELLLVIVQGLYYFVGSLAGVFLNIFLYKQGDFGTVAVFNAGNYFMLLTTYCLSGFILKYVAARYLVASGLVLLSVFWFILLTLSRNAITYIVPLSFFMGIDLGLFWSGINLIQYVTTHQERRNRYFGNLNALSNFGRSFAPALGGLIVSIPLLSYVSLDGYKLLFGLVCILDMITAIIALKLPACRGVVFSLKHLISHKRTGLWRRVLWQQGVLGVWDLSYSTVIGILLYQVLLKETSVGLVTGLGIFILSISSFYMPRYLTKYRNLKISAALLISAGLVMFGLSLQPVLMVFGMLVIGLAMPAIAIPLYTEILNGIDTNPEPWQHKYHMFIERDFVLNLTRTLSYVSLYLLFSTFGKTVVARWWLMMITVLPPFLVFLLRDNADKEEIPIK